MHFAIAREVQTKLLLVVHIRYTTKTLSFFKNVGFLKLRSTTGSTPDCA